MKPIYGAVPALLAVVLYLIYRNPAVILALIASGIAIAFGSEYIDLRRNEEKRNMMVPSFLRDLSSFSSYGMSMYNILHLILSEDLGPLNEDVRNARAILDNGNTIEEVSAYLRSRNSRDLDIVAEVMKNADRAGRPGTTLQFLSTYMNERMSQRKNATQTAENYVGLIIASFMIFLLVMIVVDYYFIQRSGFLLIDYISAILIIQSIFTGFYTGLVRYSSIRSGLFYSGMLVTITVTLLTVARLI
ncbi:TVG1068999 [Thermoplasma volcanium GSS1]|uniref:TVG1068999 protein n=1 Tax=Thermoplasma volcanium (strain ATCC 51530 / DSM 4299 / JCM 9571 / NBRC 15438 / GSS1) TaxID=273116 RepID=Q979W7_THEVO|nr:type II secretion system F family protein [Thermoplasma volcanium]BAB60185.1 TVG1068999 [Thermoplasma volcanium GSS1]